MEIADTETISHFRIDIIQDTDPGNPVKEYDQFGTMYLFHRRIDLGHDHDLSVEAVQEMIESPDVFFLPVYGYEHGGITISTGPFSCPWDSGQLGVIAVTREKVIQEWKDDSAETIEKVYKLLKAEIETYDDYLTGNCWGYVVTDEKTDTELDSCWGFLGDSDYCMQEAKSVVQHYIDKEESQVAFT